MHYEINDTTDYHIYELETLGWELTLCNALDPEESPCRRILKRNDSYGHLLYDYLGRFIPMHSLRKIIEIGGGYGYLTRDFMNRNNALEATMLDVSPYLLQKQRYILRETNAHFIQADIMDVQSRELQSFDLAILNENLGDLPTMVGIPREAFALSQQDLDLPLKEVRTMFDRYAINPPEGERGNVNIGALKVLEKLCHAGIPYIFMSEHSCEARAPEPWRRFMQIEPTGNPERIRLRGHDEYTIRFSDLEKMSRAFQYQIIRGPFVDFLAFDFSEQVGYILRTRFSQKDEHEVIRHFVEDLYKYEYLILYTTRPRICRHYQPGSSEICSQFKHHEQSIVHEENK
jgi:hypothetical protein